MQKWNYLFVVEEEGHPRYLNGQEIPNWQQGPTFSDAVYLLLRKGWEPVSNSSVLWLGYPITNFPDIFRRPKENDGVIRVYEIYHSLRRIQRRQ